MYPKIASIAAYRVFVSGFWVFFTAFFAYTTGIFPVIGSGHIRVTKKLLKIKKERDY